MSGTMTPTCPRRSISRPTTGALTPRPRPNAAAAAPAGANRPVRSSTCRMSTSPRAVTGTPASSDAAIGPATPGVRKSARSDISRGSLSRSLAAVPGLLDRVLPGRVTFARTRRRLAERHLRGEGIEIGALHMPQPVPAGATVRYVDRSDLDGLRAHYPELAGEALVAPDIVDDGERLETVADASQDFVIANHFIEHCEDPLATLAAHARVLRPGGVLFMAVPDARAGIDVARPRTPFAHVLADHREGPDRSRAAHYREWAELVDLRMGTIARGRGRRARPRPRATPLQHPLPRLGAGRLPRAAAPRARRARPAAGRRRRPSRTTTSSSWWRGASSR